MTSTPATSPRTTLTARDPEDLLAVAPVVLGFEPTDSVVLLTFGGARQFHARVDLPPPEVLTDTVVEELVAGLLEPAVRQRVRAVAVLLYTGDPGAADRVWRGLRRGCSRTGIRVVTGLRTDGRRYHPLWGDRRLREIGVPYDISGHPFLAQAVLEGRVTYGSRDAMVGTLAPDPEAQDRVAAALAAGGWWEAPLPATGREIRAAGAWARELVTGRLAAASGPDDADLARLLRQIQQVRVRDAVWALITRPTGEQHQRFWHEVVRRTPDALAAAPAALLGWSAWQAGHGALAWAAVDRCRTVDPEYRMASILAHLLEHAVPPDEIAGEFAWDEGLAR